MLEFSHSAQRLANNLYREQQQLESFASLSIFDPTTDKDRYLESTIQFLLETPNDSANGCVFVSRSAIDESNVVYASPYNAVFACWLLCAAKALCNGDLSHYGKLIIEGRRTQK